MRKAIMALVCLSAVIGFAACGGGGSSSWPVALSPDTMTITLSDLSSAVTTTYTEGGYNVHGYLDPNLSSYVTGSDNTWILLSTGATGAGVDLSVNIAITGKTPGSYPTGTTASSTFVGYTTYASGTQIYSSRYSATTGTVTLSKVGNVGDMITGSFEAEMALMSNHSDTRGISGTFCVKREN